MADVSKAQKLASARKKFKELKKEKKKNSNQTTEENAGSSSTTREQTPVENILSENLREEVRLPTYFNDNINHVEYQQPTAFFDSFAYNGDPNSYTSSAYAFPGNYFNSGFADVETARQDNSAHLISEATDDNKFQEHKKPQVHDTVKIDPQKNAAEEVPPDAVDTTEIKSEPPDSLEILTNQILEPIKHDSPVSLKAEVSSFQSPDASFVENPLRTPELSNVESLLQLKNEMAELLDPNCSFMPSTIHSDLDVRNQELAALLSQEKIKSEHLNVSLLEYQAKLAEAEAELRDRQLNTDNKIEQEVSRLREELQCHVQTVGILVAEKTELVANLSQFQMVAKQKTGDCEELQGRLKTSRSRVADLEREVVLLKNERLQNDNLGREQGTELEKLKKHYQVLREEKEELAQDVSEVKEKLKNSSESNFVLQQQIAELTNQLSMANIKIQQLSVGDSQQVSAQVEELMKEKFTLEKQIADLTQTVKTLSKDRDESSLQYQQYAQQLNAQFSNLASRLEQLQKENEILNVQEQNRIKHIGDLEKQLQNIQNDQVNFALQRNSHETKLELDAALELMERLKIEISELQEENVRILNEKEMVVKELAAKGESVAEYERLVEELRGNQPDNAKLLAIMESDKVAAARAVLQNTEMKKQMESMQEVFDKLNTDKIELTEKVSIEQRSNKDLFEKLQKTELHLQSLADAIEIKDKELIHLRENSLNFDKQIIQSEQLTDRLRHYEAQDNSSHSLQSELQEANQTIMKLTDEVNQLKHKQIVDRVDKSNPLEEVEPEENETKDESTDSNHNHALNKETAMKHLETKFLKTMEDIANLTEEKQGLEHLVLQLQSETETIGEYVALYQYQRSLLKQKAIEKDQQLTQLANDREHMKNKLEKLNDLVKKLVLEKGSVPSELLQEHRHEGGLCEEHAKISDEINKIAQSNVSGGISNPDDKQSKETAEQIIALLGEIKSSNLVQPNENFHHCPWCSGQLITV